MTWFHFRWMKTGFLFFFFVADHLLVGQLCTNPKSDRSLVSCLKVTQCSTSEIGDPSYDNRTIATTTLKMQIRTVQRLWAQRIGRPFGVSGAEGHRQEDPDQGLHRKGPGNHWWNSQWSIRQIARDLGVSHTTVNACVKEDLKCWSYRRQTSQILTEKTKNLRLMKSDRPPPHPTWTRWTTLFGHTSRTSPTWLPTTPKPAWSLLSAEFPPALDHPFVSCLILLLC